jgi:hypothetical protein
MSWTQSPLDMNKASNNKPFDYFWMVIANGKRPDTLA